MLYVIFVGTLGLIFGSVGFVGCAGLGALPPVAIIEAVSMSMILTSGFLYIFFRIHNTLFFPVDIFTARFSHICQESCRSPEMLRISRHPMRNVISQLNCYRQRAKLTTWDSVLIAPLSTLVDLYNHSVGCTSSKCDFSCNSH